MDAITLQVYVWFFLTNLRDTPPGPFESILIDAPTILNNPSALGTIIFDNLALSGLETIDISGDMMDHINVTQDDPDLQIFKVCTHLAIGHIGINSKYAVDIGINDTVPIYGEGDLGISATELKMDFCTMTNIAEGRLYNMDLRMDYRYEPVTITGFYKHPITNEMMSKVVNIANALFTIWNAYEPLKGSCVLSPVFEYLCNSYMGYPYNTFSFDQTCLEGK